MSIPLAKSKKQRVQPPPFEQTVLLLQGGGALRQPLVGTHCEETTSTMCVTGCGGGFVDYGTQVAGGRASRQRKAAWRPPEPWQRGKIKRVDTVEKPVD